MPWIKTNDSWVYDTEDPHLKKLQTQAGKTTAEYERAAAWKTERASIRRWRTLLMYRSAVAIRKLNDRVRNLCKRLG